MKKPTEKLHAEMEACLRSMIRDGCQLVHGGRLLDWNETRIGPILRSLDASSQKTITKSGKTVVR